MPSGTGNDDDATPVYGAGGEPSSYFAGRLTGPPTMSPGHVLDDTIDDPRGGNR